MAFVPKKTSSRFCGISGQQLVCCRRSTDALGMTVIKYWNDSGCRAALPIDLPDLTIFEFSLPVPIRVCWGCGKDLVVSDVVPFLY